MDRRVSSDSRIAASSSMMRMRGGGIRTGASGELAGTARVPSDMRGFPQQGKLKIKRSAQSHLTLHVDFSGMFLNDAVGDGEAEAGAAGLPISARGLGGEERIVDAAQVLGGDARPPSAMEMLTWPFTSVAMRRVRDSPLLAAAPAMASLAFRNRLRKTCCSLPALPMMGGRLGHQVGLHADLRRS